MTDKFCYCDIGAGGRPCVSRFYCDARRAAQRMSLDETRWMLNHFEPDVLEQKAISMTIEVGKLIATLVFGMGVLSLLL